MLIKVSDRNLIVEEVNVFKRTNEILSVSIETTIKYPLHSVAYCLDCGKIYTEIVLTNDPEDKDCDEFYSIIQFFPENEFELKFISKGNWNLDCNRYGPSYDVIYTDGLLKLEDIIGSYKQ